jgi:hypothetical protein
VGKFIDIEKPTYLDFQQEIQARVEGEPS